MLRLLVVVVVVLVACASRVRPADVIVETARALDPRALVENYDIRTRDERPQFDGRVPEVSEAAVDRALARARIYIETVDAIDPARAEPEVREGLARTRLDAERTIEWLGARARHRRIATYDWLFDTSSYADHTLARAHLAGAAAQVDGLLAVLDAEQPLNDLVAARRFLSDQRRAAVDLTAGPEVLAAIDRVLSWIDSSKGLR